jgi:single-stranded DNA-binding protein
MIDALIQGRLFGKPQSRTSKNNNKFVTAKMRIPMQDGAPAFANIIAFRDSVTAALLALDDGSSLCVSGELKISTYTAKDGTTRPSLDITAHEILTEFHVTRRRKAMAKDGATESEPPARSQQLPLKSAAVAAGEEEFNDDISDIPF